MLLMGASESMEALVPVNGFYAESHEALVSGEMVLVQLDPLTYYFTKGRIALSLFKLGRGTYATCKEGTSEYRQQLTECTYVNKVCYNILSDCSLISISR